MACAILFPRLGALEWKDIENKIPWPMLIWLGFAMSLAGVVDKTQGFQWVMDAVFVKAPFLANMGFVSFLTVLLVTTIFLHIMFSGMNAMIMIMVPVAITLAKVKGFDPFSIGLAVSLAVTTAAFFLPFNSAPNLIFFSSGRYDVKQHLMGALPLSILITLSLLFALFVWWPFIGLVK
jgi:sodium-dependent dicarboxylate transporter 2/3/5